MDLTPQSREVVELLVVCAMMLLAFPLAEVIRLNFLTNWITDPPRWRIAWRTGGGVLALNLLWAKLGAPSMAPEDFPLWLALVIYAVMAFQTWLFVLWAMRWWDKGIAALRRRQDRERDDTDRR